MVWLLLVNGGETAWDRQKRVLGNADLPLSEAGAAAAARCTRRTRAFPVDVVYSGNPQNCADTAAILAAEHDVSVRYWDQLDEVGVGLWEGMLLAEIERKHPKAYREWRRRPLSVCPPGGEMLTDAYRRARALLAELSRQHAGERVAVVTPRLLGGLLHCALRDRGPEDIWDACEHSSEWEIVCLPTAGNGR